MKFLAFSLLLVALLESTDGKKKPKPKESCFACLLEHAAVCIPVCIPNPFNAKCLTCLVTNGLQCLVPCGFPSEVKKIDTSNTCKAKLQSDGKCTVFKDDCEIGFVATPTQILPFFPCLCICEPLEENKVGGIFGIIGNALDTAVSGVISTVGLLADAPLALQPIPTMAPNSTYHWRIEGAKMTKIRVWKEKNGQECLPWDTVVDTNADFKIVPFVDPHYTCKVEKV